MDLSYVEIRIFLLEIFQQRNVDSPDVALIQFSAMECRLGIAGDDLIQIMLMVVLGLIKPLQRDDLSNNLVFEYMGRVEILNILLGDRLLRIVRVKDRRAVLRAHIVVLAVQ